MTEINSLNDEASEYLPGIGDIDVPATHSSPIVSREEALQMASKALKQISTRCTCKKFVPGKFDRERAAWGRLMIQMLNSYNQVLASQEMEVIGKRLEIIEQRLGGNK